MIYYVFMLLIITWIIIVYISKFNLSKVHKIDKNHVKKRKVFRFYSIIVFSFTIYLILNPTVIGTSISTNLYALWIFWFVCEIGGIKFLYDITGPILSKDFVSKLKSNNYAVYLRSFNIEKNNIINSVENELCSFLKKGIPVFAIGDPYEVISSIGAERLYASDDDWENMIIDLISDGKMIIIRPSSSSGCLIELNHIVRLKILSKCLFIVSSREEIVILQNYLNLKNNSDLQLLEKFMTNDNVLGLKIEENGKYSSFVFKSTNENLANFLILYGIDIDNKAKAIHLSMIQHILDRITFVLNPLFYSSLFEWGPIMISIVFIIMLCPVIIINCSSNGIPISMMLFIFVSFILLLVYQIIKAPYISQSKSQYASATHYITRMYYLFYFNLIFILAFIIMLLANPIFRYSFWKAVRTVCLLLITSIYNMLTSLWLIVIAPLVLYYIWKMCKKKNVTDKTSLTL